MPDPRLKIFYKNIIKEAIGHIDSIQRGSQSQMSQEKIEGCKKNAYMVILVSSSALELIDQVPVYDSKKSLEDLFGANLINDLTNEIPDLVQLITKLGQLGESIGTSQPILQPAIDNNGINSPSILNKVLRDPDMRHAEVFGATLLVQSMEAKQAIEKGNPQEKGFIERFLVGLNDAWEKFKSLFSCGRNDR